MFTLKTKKRIIKQITLIMFVAFALSACSLGWKPKPTPNNTVEIQTNVQATPPKTIQEQLARQSEIRKFSNYDEIKIFLEDNDGGSGSVYGRGFGSTATMKSIAAPMVEVNRTLGAPMEEMADMAQNATGMGAGSTDFSTTNIQVEGVDEADIIKTDGKYIYAVSKNNLFIIDAYPAEDSTIISKIEFKSNPQDIYINGNSLIVYGNDNNISNSDFYIKLSSSRRYSPYTFLKVFDISDKKNPKQVRDLDFEGNYINSRMIGDYVYFVTTTYSYYLDEDVVIPKIVEDGEVLSNDKADARCNCPNIYYFDIPYQQYNFTSIATVNITDNSQKINNEIYLLAGNQNMYVSQSNIYLTYTKYINEETLAMEVVKEMVLPKLSEKDRDKIAKIETVDNFILSKEEKLNKIGLVLQRYVESLSETTQDELEKKIEEKYKDISKELEKTVIHKIAINKENLVYQNFGEVTGQILNQFSMDENNGYFRIATTKNRTWSQFAEEDQKDSYNNLYVLNGDLKVVGAVENLAEGERIYSVRFMQNRAYMVTFKQTDPLFVIDLKDPENPKVLGTLKIPGFSNYLHPYDENTLIGLGRDTQENERGGVTNGGIKLSLFDVSDVEKPKEIDTYVIGDSSTSSIALNDHKAFLFSRNKNLLVIPITKKNKVFLEDKPVVQCIGDGCVTPSRPSVIKNFRGAMVFYTDKDGFKLKGEINHDDGSEISEHRYGYNYYGTTVKRSLYVDDVLYTFSNKYLKMNELNNLELVKNLKLEKNSGETYDFEIIN
ncbi:MAG: beta-propeller domain-containing protein [bacterium]